MISSMEFSPDAVEIFTSEVESEVKCRMCVGYAIGDTLYSMQKFGGVIPIVDGESRPDQRITELARRSYECISNTGEISFDLFAYELGVPCEFDGDGLPIGEWPAIGKMTVNYTAKFLMPEGKLPLGYEHLLQLHLLGQSR